MKKILTTLSLFGLLALGNGCVAHYAHGISAGTGNEGTEVTGEASGVGILMLTAPTLDAKEDLKKKCPSGKGGLPALSPLTRRLQSPRSRLGCGLFFLATLLAANPAFAQSSNTAPIRGGVPRFRDWRGVDFGVLASRQWGRSERQSGIDIAVSQSFRSLGSPLFFGGRDSYRLQVQDGFALSRRGDISAGFRAGQALLEAQVGAEIFTLDRIEGQWSVGMLSPRVGVGVGFIVDGSLYVGVSGYSAYTWRWFGPDRQNFGVTLHINRVRPPP